MIVVALLVLLAVGGLGIAGITTHNGRTRSSPFRLDVPGYHLQGPGSWSVLLRAPRRRGSLRCGAGGRPFPAPLSRCTAASPGPVLNAPGPGLTGSFGLVNRHRRAWRE